MPIASGAGHWPKEHILSSVPPTSPNPSGAGYVQSYMPQWVPPNKVQPPKTSYIVTGGNPSNPKSPYPSPNYPKGSPYDPSSGHGNPGYDTPPPKYNPANPGNQGRHPSYNSRTIDQSKPPKMFRAGQKYGEPGHNRFGNDGVRPETDFGHNKYGVKYDNSRSVIINSKGARPVGPKGLESYELYGPRMNMTTGLCGPQMRPLCALLGGLLALAALGGIIAGIALGVKSKTDASTRKLTYVNPLKNIRYYQQNGVYEPCVDRYATTTPLKTTARAATTTPVPTTVILTTAHTCIPLTFNTNPVTCLVNCTTRAIQTTTVCINTTPGPTTQEPTTTTTTIAPTTTPPLTTGTTLPFCDTLTTTYTLVTLFPLVYPVSTAENSKQVFGVTIFLLFVSTSAKLLIG